MSFADFLSQEQKKQEGFNNDNVERYTPKQPVLRLGKQKDGSQKEQVLVRILPATDGGFAFAKAFRTTFINYTKKNGEQTGSGLTLPADNGSSVLDPFITDWISKKVQFSRFPNKPSLRYFIHVIEYVNNGGQLQPMKDDQGNLKVQPMEISGTAYTNIINALGDPMLAPKTETDLRFIAPDNAFIVNIRKAKKGEMQWGVTVYPTVELGALPNNWKELTSDLDKLATPTEEQNPKFVNFLINNVNNTELSTDNFKFNRETNTLGEEPTPKQESPSEQDISNMMPDNLTQQQPTQNNQPYQPTDNPFDVGDLSEPEPYEMPQQPTQQKQEQTKQQEQPKQAPTQQNNQSMPQDINSILGDLDIDI
ncbi:hypothetical protein TwortDSMZ_151 [Staphylococcus phage Twort]|uniref:ORF022 n=2 Tax=Staphylococcus phage Twort (strain DSM 17442 / HER 48) TaxID=2908167 RepID=Q4Z994_BPTWO|nr:ORF022 [Staphylococcus phage Twort]AAX92318.1 ORF022 [Staphylococcus phage Twort]QIW89150.1 hypothetical protein TwortDSMZ_151 [Staphylococcus phage Twort]